MLLKVKLAASGFVNQFDEINYLNTYFYPQIDKDNRHVTGPENKSAQDNEGSKYKKNENEEFVPDEERDIFRFDDNSGYYDDYHF